jgi:hypothetical protein
MRKYASDLRFIFVFTSEEATSKGSIADYVYSEFFSRFDHYKPQSDYTPSAGAIKPNLSSLRPHRSTEKAQSRRA